MPPMIPQVTLEETRNFARQWSYNGLVLPMDDAHLQFAMDFANVALRSFVQFCQEQTIKKMQEMQALAAREDEKKIILEE